MPETPLSAPPQGANNPPPVRLRVRGVTKVFENAGQRVEALQSLDLEIREGEFVVLFGPSGCGKSTLLNMIAGFDPPSTGTITLDDQPVTRPGQDRLMMFQEHALFPWLSVTENISYGLRWHPAYRFKRRARRKRVDELLKLVHLEEFSSSLIHQLSGGMKQRVALARALAPEPKILLIDEPFPALDALVRAKLYAELQDILVRTHKTIVSVTHDPREAACLGDRVIVFSGRPGKIREEILIDLPRPRDINDPGVTEYAGRITAQLESTNDEQNGKAP